MVVQVKGRGGSPLPRPRAQVANCGGRFVRACQDLFFPPHSHHPASGSTEL